MNKIGQHLLLSDKARIMSLMDIFRLGDDEAFDLFKQARWAGNNGEPVCPHCGGAYHYHIKTRKQWRCKACGHTFPTGCNSQITSNTSLCASPYPKKWFFRW